MNRCRQRARIHFTIVYLLALQILCLVFSVQSVLIIYSFRSDGTFAYALVMRCESPHTIPYLYYLFVRQDNSEKLWFSCQMMSWFIVFSFLFCRSLSPSLSSSFRIMWWVNGDGAILCDVVCLWAANAQIGSKISQSLFWNSHTRTRKMFRYIYFCIYHKWKISWAPRSIRLIHLCNLFEIQFKLLPWDSV